MWGHVVLLVYDLHLMFFFLITSESIYREISNNYAFVL